MGHAMDMTSLSDDYGHKLSSADAPVAPELAPYWLLKTDNIYSTNPKMYLRWRKQGLTCMHEHIIISILQNIQT